MTAPGHVGGTPHGGTAWPGQMDALLAQIRGTAAADPARAREIADALTADLAPAVTAIAERQCRAVRRPDLAADAAQNALHDVLRELRAGHERQHPRTYLRVITLNAVSRTVTASGGLHPTAAQRRRASLAAAAGQFIAATGRPPSDSELLAAQHDLVAGRADAKDQAAIATIDEVRAFLAGEESFTEEGTRDEQSTEARIPRQRDHAEDELALDPLDAQRLIRLTAAAFPAPRPHVDGPAFAAAVLTRTMNGTFSPHDLAAEHHLTRSVTRTAVKNVWETAARVLRDDIGVTSLRAS